MKMNKKHVFSHVTFLIGQNVITPITAQKQLLVAFKLQQEMTKVSLNNIYSKIKNNVYSQLVCSQ